MRSFSDWLFFQFIIIAICSVMFVACGEDEIIIIDPSDPSPTPTPVVECPNPISNGELFTSGDGLWKPVAEATSFFGGNLVVLLHSKFTSKFNRCYITKNGEPLDLICIDNSPDTQIPYSCFSNGNRQTWRSPITCGNVDEVKVTCEDACQTITFTVPSEDINEVCQRHE